MTLNDNDINFEKSKALKINDDTIENLIKNLYNNNQNLFIKILDIQYDLFFYNKKRKIKQKLKEKKKLFFLVIKICMII